MLDRDERGNTIETILAKPRAQAGTGQSLYDVKRGEYHLGFLKRRGLKRTDRVLDFGCGYGRTAVPLLRFLDRGRYIGVELSAERIRIAKQYVAREKLESCAPQFIVSDDVDLSYLGDGSIDVVWAQSVFTHMPEQDTARVLKSVARVLSSDGMAIIDYDTTSANGVQKRNIRGYYYPEAVFERLVTDAGFTFSVLTDWEDDLPPNLRHDTIRSLLLRPVSENERQPQHGG